VAVSKRLRYEILRRDNFTCRYCMTATPGTPLRVDHVVPVALGGTDDPTNLVTSCEPCNSGKTSTVPDSPLVAQVKKDAMRWQMAWAVAVAEAKSEGKQRAKDIAKVKKNYVAAYKGRHGAAPTLPEGWEASVGRWLDLGLPMTLIDKAIASAVGRSYVPAKDRFAYFAGCCWSLLKELKDRTEQIAKQSSPDADEDPIGEEEADEADEGSLLDRVEEAFAHGWSHKEQPNSYCNRMLVAYSEAADAAGYDGLAIEYAAYSAAKDGHADISLYLKTIDDILEVAAETHQDSPFGALHIDADLLPSDEDRAAWLVANAAVMIWRKAWRDANNGVPPSIYSPEVQALRNAAQVAYRKNEDAPHVLRGAEWAGADGHVDLTRAANEAAAHHVTEPAVSAWGAAYHIATGSNLGQEHDKVWSDLYTLHAGKSWDHQITAAAVFAGAHGTTRLHFGLTDDEAKRLGVEPDRQLLEDFWAQAWHASQRPHEWPTEERRAEFQTHLTRYREWNDVLPPLSACVRAGAYRETNPADHAMQNLAGMLKRLEVDA